MTHRLRVPRWILFGLLVRVILMPLNHPWDLQTWYNMFVDLAHDHSPYATFHELTASYRADQGLLEPRNTPNAAAQETFYAYYAYPPALMIVYYPLAKLAALAVPLEPQFTFHGPAAQVIVPPLFHVFFKFPLFLAELGIVAVLWKLGGETSARRFFLNPLVILVSATWTVEALMTYPVVLSVLMVRRARYLAAAATLAAGALVKFVPAILLPTLLIYLWHQRVPRKTLASCGAVFLILCVVVIAPFWRGFQEVLLFQAARPGANLSVHLLLYPLHQFTGLDIRFLAQAVSPLVGILTQTVALALVYIYLFSRTHALTRAYLITLIAFFLGSKIVNEPYPYVLIPLILLELADHAVEAKETALKLLYALPLAFAILNVPLVYIVMPFYRYFWKGSYPVTHEWARAFPLTEHSLMLSILMLAFVAASAYTLSILMREGEHDQIGAPAH